LTASSKEIDRIEVHDPAILAAARQLLDTCNSPREMADSVVAAVKRNEEWLKVCANVLIEKVSTAARVLLRAHWPAPR
jgi:hypothetical protein